MLLSIIVPFHNSINKAEKLMATLGSLTDEDVEAILINDGSTDDTLSYLKETSADFKIKTKIISHENKGPGGARNSGLAMANGEYVWFIDSDDNFNHAAISILKELRNENYDFIDFNLVDSGMAISTMDATAGVNIINQSNRDVIINKFGRIFTKIIKKEALVLNGISYPERTLYEDNYLIFILPFYVTTFFKSEMAAYYYTTDNQSITRSKAEGKFFDRVYIAERAINRSLPLAENEQQACALKNKLAELMLINTVSGLLKRMDVFGVIMSCRVISCFNEVCKEYGVSATAREQNPTRKSGVVGLFIKTEYYFCNILSLFFKKQVNYFKALHLKNWS